MLANGNPIDTAVLDIISATYGGRDFTSVVADGFDAALQLDPTLTTWSFSPTNDYFGQDPNPWIRKCCVVVFRNSFAAPDGGVAWSQFKFRTSGEQGIITLDFSGAGDTAWEPPTTVPATGQCVVAAFWYSKDLTAVVRNLFDQAAFVEGQGVQLTVSEGSLGPMPVPWEMQFCLTYGAWRYPGVWRFQVCVGLQATLPWTLVVPPLFPPVRPPSTATQVVNFVQFSNRTADQDLYPLIYSATGALVWDGRVAAYKIVPGTSRYVDLCERAGCMDKEKYTLACCPPTGDSVWGDGRFTVIATSASVANVGGVVFSCQTGSGNMPSVSVDGASGPLAYNAADLRLNIYSATFGGADYTNFVRRLYVTSTLSSHPTDLSNSWSMTATNAAFQGDPAPQVPKACVVIYRLAYRVGRTDGIANDGSDPPQPVATDQYPVLRDISSFRSVSCREGDSITINLLTESLQPMVWPSNNSPLVTCAIWSTVDVTPFVQDTLNSAWSKAAADVSVSVGTNTMGRSVPSLAPLGDSWPGVPKQLTVLVGYHASDTAGSYQWRTLVELHAENPWYLTIPSAYSRPGTQVTQLPASFIPDQTPTFQQATFSNQISIPIWAHAAIDGGQMVWDSRATDQQGNQIDAGQERTFDLIKDVGLIEGSWYALSVIGTPDFYEPFTRWIKVSAITPQYGIKLTLMPDYNTSLATKFVMEHDITFLGV